MRAYPYWLDTLSAEQSASLRSPDSPPTGVDVLIVGAGYTGLAAARLLARTGASVLVLDREHIGFGASTRNAGQILTGLRLDVATLVRRYGEHRAMELFETADASSSRLRTVIGEESIHCDYEQRGHIQAAYKARHVRAFAAEQALLARLFNRQVTFVSRADQRSELGTDWYHGLLIDEGSAALNPARYLHGLAIAARRAGVCISTGVAVERTARVAGGWRVTGRTTGALNTRSAPVEFDAREVLLATNGYTDSLAPRLQRRLIALGSYIIVTEPLNVGQANRLLPRGRTAFDSKHFLYYFRLTPDRRLLFGGRAEFSPPTDASAMRAAERLRAGMIAVFPEMRSVKIEYAWGGTVAFTRDEMPHAGTIDGMHFAGGYCGHGVAMATYLGELIARRIAGESIVHPLLDAPFPALPFHRIARWLLPLAGAYYHVRDVIG